jgi:hypothetical protein
MVMAGNRGLPCHFQSFAGLISDDKAVQQQVQPAEFATLATKACSTGLDGLAAAFPKVRAAPLALHALRIQLCHALQFFV